MRLKWISFDKNTSTVKRTLALEKIEDTAQVHLTRLLEGADVAAKDIDALKKRTFVTKVSQMIYSLTKGKKFALKLPQLATDLTSEMVQSGEWANMEMKSYNLSALGIPPSCGYLHPLLKVRAEYRQIFLEMGFSEMKTNQYVENSFWNFDALFQPQQHPARDAHDTFFVSHPASSQQIPEDYLKLVKDMHEHGNGDSIGWRYDWSEEETRKNILRTHTTAVSSRTLYKLAQEGFRPGKYFSIDRVYRNEAMDATHLAEFHQVEGFIVDKGLTLGNLIAVIRQFFNYLGITQLKFKPAYNPYTEPSMEVFSYHEGLKKWVEIGNSGIFRPEMLLPMGFPPDVVVIAWGLSLERPTMIKYKIDNIRELVGHKLDLEFVMRHPIVRIDKH
jgi:phenylalanyl-tRNA synthetase alpha chain